MDASAHRDAPRRAARARELLASCAICPRVCRVNRLEGETGYCRLGAEAYVFQDVVHYGEEAELNPSHQVYFSGCNLVCGFCTVLEWVEAPRGGTPVDLDELVVRILRAREAGARTLNLLGGEPTVNLHVILDLLSRLPADMRVVWNSNMYYEPVVAELLTGLVDVYLADYKCGNNDCARDMLKAGDYLDVVQGNLLRAAGAGDLILRHLVLPGHGSCCTTPVLAWVAEHLPQVKLSLRGNYLPPADSAAPAPADFLSESAFAVAVDEAQRLEVQLIE